jgi:hypothetical protein
MKKQLGLLGAVLVCVGCGGGSSAPPPPPEGTVTFDWTVKGVHEPQECDVENVATFDVIIYDDTAAQVGEFSARCDVFDMSVNLVEGHYTANAVLLDPSGRELTTEIPVTPFDLIGTTELVIPLDFPPDSFRSVPR